MQRVPDVLVDTRWEGAHGIGRYTRELLARLPLYRPLKLGLPVLHPLNSIVLSTVLWKEHPEVFFSPGFNPPLYSPVPYLFTIHDLIHLRVPAEQSVAKKVYYTSVVLPAARRASYVLTDSVYSQRDIMEWTGLPEERVVVTGVGVGNEFSPLGAPYSPGYRYLLYVGNRKPHKNVPRLLRAFAASKASRDLRLVLSGREDSETTQLVSRLGLVGKVVFAGLIPDAELPSYYRGAVALVFPSLFEGFGLPPLEAMACGTPVVTSRTASLPEVVGDAAILVEPLDTEALTHAIDQIVFDTAHAAILRQRGLQRALQFTWERTSDMVWKTILDATSR